MQHTLADVYKVSTFGWLAFLTVPVLLHLLLVDRMYTVVRHRWADRVFVAATMLGMLGPMFFLVMIIGGLTWQDLKATVPHSMWWAVYVLPILNFFAAALTLAALILEERMRDEYEHPQAA